MKWPSKQDLFLCKGDQPKTQTNRNNNIKRENDNLLPSVKVLSTVIPLSNRGDMARGPAAQKYQGNMMIQYLLALTANWLSAPHSQVMVSQAGWPKGKHPWQVQTSQAGLGLPSQVGLGLSRPVRQDWTFPVTQGWAEPVRQDWFDLSTGRRPQDK